MLVQKLRKGAFCAILIGLALIVSTQASYVVYEEFGPRTDTQQQENTNEYPSDGLLLPMGSQYGAEDPSLFDWARSRLSEVGKQIEVLNSEVANGFFPRQQDQSPYEQVEEQLQQVERQRIDSAMRDYQLGSNVAGLMAQDAFSQPMIVEEVQGSFPDFMQRQPSDFERVLQQKMREVESRLSEGSLGPSMAQRLNELYTSEDFFNNYMQQQASGQQLERLHRQEEQQEQREQEDERELASALDRMTSILDFFFSPFVCDDRCDAVSSGLNQGPDGSLAMDPVSAWRSQQAAQPAALPIRLQISTQGWSRPAPPPARLSLSMGFLAMNIALLVMLITLMVHFAWRCKAMPACRRHEAAPELTEQDLTAKKLGPQADTKGMGDDSGVVVAADLIGKPSA